MKHYFGYTRVSTVKQGEKGVSLNEQRDAINRYAERNGLTISEWFEERETAAKRGRPVFDRMMRLLRQSNVGGVIIHKIDRSARNLKDWADLGEIIDKGIEVHFVNESLDLHTRGGRLSADIQAVVAADFIRNLKEETRKGFYGRFKQGLYPIPAPLGYIDMGKGKPKEPDPRKAPFIRKTFELYCSGKYTLDTLVEEMFSLGLRNRKGNKVTRNGISVMLNNPFYIGLIRIKCTGETFQGAHKPLIRASLFKKTQEILKGKSNSKAVKHEFLFRRLLSCSHCGYSLIGEMHKGHIYYRCHTRSCPATCVKEDAVEGLIEERLIRLQLQQTEIDYLQKKMAWLKDTREERARDQVKSLELNTNQLQDRLIRLTDAYIDRMIDKDIFEQRKATLLLEKKSLEEKVNGIKAKTGTIIDELSNFLELAGNAYVSYKMGFHEEKRDFLKIVTSNWLVEGKNIELKLKFPFQEVENRHFLTYGTPERDRPRTYYLDVLFDRLYEHFKKQAERPARIESDLSQEAFSRTNRIDEHFKNLHPLQ